MVGGESREVRGGSAGYAGPPAKELGFYSEEMGVSGEFSVGQWWDLTGFTSFPLAAVLGTGERE